MVSLPVASGALAATLTSTLLASGCARPLVVCDPIVAELPAVAAWLPRHQVFTAFGPNPTDAAVIAGMTRFALADCDGLVAIGGGSAIDVAKCIKAWQGLRQPPFVAQPLQANGLPLIAVPTTAGTGSEVTPFAAVYHAGQKHSVAAPWLRPTVALLAPELLATLPYYQRVCGLLDALSQAVESFWAQAATPESQAHAHQAIRTILTHHQAFLAADPAAEAAMMTAAHEAGQAIAITTTTGGHALSYGLTHRYHFAHGHAVALCLPEVWHHLLAHPEAWRHPKGAAYLAACLQQLGVMFGGKRPEDALLRYRQLVATMALPALPAAANDAAALATVVNRQRLANHPARLAEPTLTAIYQTILA